MKNLNIYSKKSILKAQRYSKPFIGFFTELDIITPKLMENNEYLTHAVLNPSAKIIGENAFHGNVSLQTISGNPQIISDEAFSFCSNLTTFNFEQVSSIGKKAFQYSGLKKIKFGPSIQIIKESTFSGCLNLKEVDFSNIEIIEHHAFESTGLISVVFSPKLKKIGNQAFEGCTFLKNIVCLTPHPPRICESTFNGAAIEKVWVVNERIKEEFLQAKYWKNYAEKIEIIDWIAASEFAEKLRERDKERTEKILLF